MGSTRCNIVTGATNRANRTAEGET